MKVRLRKEKLYYGKTSLGQNLRRIQHFQNLKPGWNGYGPKSSLAIPKEICRLCMHVILNLPENRQPKIFPAGCGFLQFEYGSLRTPEKFGPHFCIEIRTDLCREHGADWPTAVTFERTKENILASVKRYFDTLSNT